MIKLNIIYCSFSTNPQETWVMFFCISILNNVNLDLLVVF